MKKVLFAIMLFACSCCTVSSHQIDGPAPVESFASVYVFPEGTTRVIFGSGSVVRKMGSAGYILTAEHVCETKAATWVKPLYGEKTKAIVIKEDKVNDLCLLYVPEMEGGNALRIAPNPPVLGATYTLLGAPHGMVQERSIPILKGAYSGMYRSRENHLWSMWTIPIAPGCSGGAVVNNKGELVSVIHHGRAISFGARHKTIVAFLKGYI